MDVKILVASHKKYQMPEDSIYLPVQAGCAYTDERFGYACDNTGDNISDKNRYYSEMSVVYWAWKNLEADYFGICHYRRYFVSKKKKKNFSDYFKRILSREEIESLLKECPVVLPVKRKYYIETIESHYDHYHNPKDFDLTRQIIEEKYPEYLDSFNKMASSTQAHMFNAFIMRKDYFDSYCSFIFPFLEEYLKRVDLTGYNAFEARICGYISEMLMDVWVDKNNIRYIEAPFAFLEKQNWPLKIFNFFKRKFLPSARAFN